MTSKPWQINSSSDQDICNQAYRQTDKHIGRQSSYQFHTYKNEIKNALLLIVFYFHKQ